MLMLPDSALIFLTNLLFLFFMFFFEVQKNAKYGVARKFGNVFRFTGEIIAINGGNEFENQCNEIYRPELFFCNGKCFIYRDHISEPSFFYKRSLYDKRSSYSFNLVDFHIKVAAYLQK